MTGLPEGYLYCSKSLAAWDGRSVLLGGFKVQWHTLSRWFANVEIDVRLLVAFGVLLSPQYQQKQRKLCKDNLRPVVISARPESVLEESLYALTLMSLSRLQVAGMGHSL